MKFTELLRKVEIIMTDSKRAPRHKRGSAVGVCDLPVEFHTDDDERDEEL